MMLIELKKSCRHLPARLFFEQQVRGFKIYLQLFFIIRIPKFFQKITDQQESSLSQIVEQNKSQNLDRSIVLALERVSQVFRTLLWDYGKKKKLSPIQIQFLVHISGHSKKYSSVSEMARTFNLTAATVSDAIKSLEKKGLVQKIVSRRDGRKFPISLTKEGLTMSNHLADWYSPLLEHIHNFPSESREAVLIFLLKLVESLKQNQLLEEIKTCLSCKYLADKSDAKNNQKAYCLLRKVSLNISELRLNCPNFNASIG